MMRFIEESHVHDAHMHIRSHMIDCHLLFACSVRPACAEQYLYGGGPLAGFSEFLKAVDKGARRGLLFFPVADKRVSIDELALLNLLADDACRMRVRWIARAGYRGDILAAAREVSAGLLEVGLVLSPPPLVKTTSACVLHLVNEPQWPSREQNFA